MAPAVFMVHSYRTVGDSVYRFQPEIPEAYVTADIDCMTQ